MYTMIVSHLLDVPIIPTLVGSLDVILIAEDVKSMLSMIQLTVRNIYPKGMEDNHFAVMWVQIKTHAVPCQSELSVHTEFRFAS